MYEENSLRRASRATSLKEGGNKAPLSEGGVGGADGGSPPQIGGGAAVGGSSFQNGEIYYY